MMVSLLFLTLSSIRLLRVEGNDCRVFIEIYVQQQATSMLLAVGLNQLFFCHCRRQQATSNKQQAKDFLVSEKMKMERV